MAENKLIFNNNFEYVILETIYKSNINKTAFYKALEKYTGRIVGIKYIETNPNLINEYLNGVRVLINLENKVKNIPTIYQYYTNKTSLFVIMQYIEGNTLSKLMESEKEIILSKETTYLNLKRLKKICEVLSSVHKNGNTSSYTQHKDLKPQNIIVKGKFPNEDVYLIDFDLSSATIAKGTIGYQSPEQSDMFSKMTNSTRIDVFSFGLIMYEILCGKKLNFGEHLVLDIECLKWKSIPKISDINKNVDKQIDLIFEKCIAFNPNERFNNGGEILCQIRKIVR